MTAIDPLEVSALRAVHIVGIGGAGMSAIARVLLARGVDVRGSDAKDSRRIATLRALGADISVGHNASNLGEAQTVISSTAIPESNVELRAARDSGRTVLNRASALAMLMRDSTGIAVTGTHGKTTTTSMLTVALQSCGADPSFVIGSELHETGANAHWGTGQEFVVEADESDGTFLALPAAAGVVTNLEVDHLDTWGTEELLVAGYDKFMAGVADRDGFVVICADDAGAAALAQRARDADGDVRTYGCDAAADFRIDLLGPGLRGQRFDVVAGGVRSGAVELAVPGLHNVRNATAAFATVVGLGYAAEQARIGLASFTGTRRRMEFRGTADGVRVYDDYAHHPTEIRATLTAIREWIGSARLIVAFQAHHYYRTALFLEDFGAALGLADDVVVLEVFAPGETPIPGASGMAMAAAVPKPSDRVVFEPSWSRVAGHLVSRAASGDVVLTLGAGDVALLALEVLDLLRAREAM